MTSTGATVVMGAGRIGWGSCWNRLVRSCSSCNLNDRNSRHNCSKCTLHPNLNNSHGKLH
jgi:hypothetical protein